MDSWFEGFSCDLGIFVTLVISLITFLKAKNEEKKKQQESIKQNRQEIMNFLCVDWNALDDECRGDKKEPKYVVVIGNYTQKVLRDFWLQAGYPSGKTPLIRYAPFLRPGEYFVSSSTGSIEDLGKKKAKGLYYHPMVNTSSGTIAKGYSIKAHCTDIDGIVWGFTADAESGSGGKYMWERIENVQEFREGL